jgi:hypothetical protein
MDTRTSPPRRHPTPRRPASLNTINQAADDQKKLEYRTGQLHAHRQMRMFVGERIWGAPQKYEELTQ